jgi:predicted ATPase
MLVAGFSGIGKTAVINEVHKPIVKQRGYFIKGKFDQFKRNIPFSAFVQAFRDLMGQLFGESDAELANWKTKSSTALGEQGQVIIEVIPELERIIGLLGAYRDNEVFPAHPLMLTLTEIQKNGSSDYISHFNPPL